MRELTIFLDRGVRQAAGGKQTGQSVDPEIMSGAAFDVAAEGLIASGFTLNWQSYAMPGKGRKKKNKIKYTCPDCQQNAWAKPEASLMCGACMSTMELVE